MDIPSSAREFLEYFEDHFEATKIYLSTWVISDGIAGFAGLQFVQRVPWLVHGVITRSASGLLDIRRLSVEAWKHEAEVTGRVLRRVRPAEVRAAAVANLRLVGSEANIHFGEPDDRPVRIFPPNEQGIRRNLIDAAKRPRKRGRPGRPDSHYRDVAIEYLDLYEKGRRKVLKEMAERRGVPPPTVRDWVRRARQLEYLGPGKQGRAGASPGPRLVDEGVEGR
jgi:hypothetical protein